MWYHVELIILSICVCRFAERSVFITTRTFISCKTWLIDIESKHLPINSTHIASYLDATSIVSIFLENLVHYLSIGMLCLRFIFVENLF